MEKTRIILVMSDGRSGQFVSDNIDDLLRDVKSMYHRKMETKPLPMIVESVDLKIKYLDPISVFDFPDESSASEEDG